MLKNIAIWICALALSLGPVFADAGGPSFMFHNGAVTNSAVTVKPGSARLTGYFVTNTNAAVCYVQFFNALAANVTVGTTVPVKVLGIPATSSANLSFESPPFFATAMSVSATTTPTGGSACSSTIDVSVDFQ